MCVWRSRCATHSHVVSSFGSFNLHCNNSRRFYGKISGNKLPVRFSLFSQAPVNIFRTAETCTVFGHITLQPYKGIFECVG